MTTSETTQTTGAVTTVVTSPPAQAGHRLAGKTQRQLVDGLAIVIDVDKFYHETGLALSVPTARQMVWDLASRLADEIPGASIDKFVSVDKFVASGLGHNAYGYEADLDLANQDWCSWHSPDGAGATHAKDCPAEHKAKADKA